MKRSRCLIALMCAVFVSLVFVVKNGCFDADSEPVGMISLSIEPIDCEYSVGESVKWIEKPNGDWWYGRIVEQLADCEYNLRKRGTGEIIKKNAVQLEHRN